ncbi:hypothetical protein VKT23_008774 [Stygiomarasmius scandens]|uniref:SET domain-containing protein n=1 Tax=Marasmiellus scandens TaxID=2682957 RepID=A0ABR1JJQ0_9AGAR
MIFSCRPNAERDWDSPTFSLQLRASKPIKKGEEITITYISDVTDPTKERQRQLASYGFTCTCEACSNPKLSDPKSKEIKELLKPAMFLFDPMAMDWVNPATGVGIGMDMPSGMPGMTPMGMASSKGKKSQTGAFDVATNLVNSIVEPALRGLKLMEEEGLYGNSYGELLGRVANGYEMMGQSSKEKSREAKAWAEKYERYQKYFESARNAKQREEKEQEEKSKRNEGRWHEDKQLAEMMNEMMKKMNA